MTSFLITQKFHSSLKLANKQRSDGYPMLSNINYNRHFIRLAMSPNLKYFTGFM